MKHKLIEISLDDTPFYKSLLKRTKNLYLTETGRTRHQLNFYDYYQKNVLEICLRISALLKILRNCRFFLDERRSIPIDNELKIKNADFIRYHIECYFIRMTTFKDLILKLYNRVYGLDVVENAGLEKNLKKRANKDNLSILLDLLEGVSILMQNIEPIRHKIAHGGYYDNVDLIIIESEETIRENNKNKCLKNDEYDLLLKQLLKKNILEMYAIEIEMVTFVILSYKKLYPIRKEKEKELTLKT